MYSCTYCSKEFDNKRSLNAHRCSAGSKKREELLRENREEILDLFVNQHWPVIDIATKFSLTHKRIVDFLQENGVEYNREVILSRRDKAVAKSKMTFLAKYGVDNPSKNQEVKNRVKTTCVEKYGSTNGGWSVDSQIKHYIMGKSPDPKNQEAYAQYAETVSRLTKHNKKFVTYNGQCYYSDLSIHQSKHWNDPFRATLDHKIPVLLGFEKGIPAEHIASVNNLVWCCKILNVYKSTMTEEQFKVSGIIERFKEYESYLRSISR